MSVLRVQVRELKAHLSRYLAEVRAGRAVEVTYHRKIVARIIGVPEASAGSGLASWVASGAGEWHGGKPRGARLQLSPGGRSMADLVHDDRG
jgi:prevent-host-death family protein